MGDLSMIGNNLRAILARALCAAIGDRTAGAVLVVMRASGALIINFASRNAREPPTLALRALGRRFWIAMCEVLRVFEMEPMIGIEPTTYALRK